MKKFMKRFAGVLVAFVALLTLASCSTVGKIKKAFEKEDYIWTEKADWVSEDAKEAGIDGIYLVGKDGTVLKNVPQGIVIEFSAKDAEELLKKIKEEDIFTDNAIQTIVEAASSTPVTNGNCMIITILPAVAEIFQNA